ncbi:cytochrome c oxidase subunit I [Paraburkholderia sp. MM5384-R2]|uniref:cytochrome c oxidase subunit I n=1 Tax=Paraburkholderia sp. MM5384-R2 TaxID=2723097 RepID=UPI00160F5E06|nr:cytochrome c oxidase subunit I [Paraburkholderia sp. MM5384-R2]MBB5503030.1 cytochrome c oxidase subunit I+III [Paraburkholderia sp. MM5384-R2]
MSVPVEPPSQGITALRLHRQLAAIWATGPGVQRLAAVNHTVLGMRMMITSFVFFAIAGILGMLTRVQLATPHAAFMDVETYNQVFTMHGSMMLFLFAIPMVESFAVYLTPKFLGARDFAFPRLTAYGYWCYLFGGTILTVSLILHSAPDGGWFMYTPLSSNVYTPGLNADVWLLGITFVEISALSLAMEIVVSILKMRAPGMSLDRMPIFAWYILVTAMMMIVAFPPLILGSILLEVERAFNLPFFDPTRGGDPLLWQHLFWLFGHPDVYIIFLPMAGVLSTMIPVFARRKLVGYRTIVVAIIALAFLSFGIWVHHMFTVGIPHLALAFFSAGSAIVAVPTAIQFFAWLATLSHGRPRWDVPMLYIFGFFFVFTCGGLTGVMLAIVPFDWQAHDTYFVVAHLHYVVAGALAFPMLAAFYYWLPLLTGRTAVHNLSVPAFWLVFVGFNMTFFLMHLTGLLGMPRRVFTYSGDEGWNWLNLLSSVGSFVMTIGFALVVIDIVVQLRFGQRVRRNPWQSTTLEWAMPIPPAPYAFASIPHMDAETEKVSPGQLATSLARGEGYLGFTRNGWQETLGVHMTSGEPEQLIVLPNSTYLPLVTALVTAAAVLAMLFKFYLLSVAFAFVTFGLFIYAGQSAGHARDYGALPVGRGVSVPPHTEVAGAPSWLSMICALIANSTLFTSLIFGTFYLWIAAPNWPAAVTPHPNRGLALVAAVALAVAAAATRGSLRAAAAERKPHVTIGLSAIALSVALIACVMLINGVTPNPREHALGATAAALLTYIAVHAGVGLLFLISNVLRVGAGFVSARRLTDLRLTRLWVDYTLATGIIALGLVLALPSLVAVLGARP